MRQSSPSAITLTSLSTNTGALKSAAMSSRIE